ncbi:sensor histidine kinase KdpD [Trichocoleus sp. FACHB-262]|uniref:sensor histidine kinase n=1 Tax=Trichocoleus sp. FACHB-262 TaxID=2692869 RepID=UPI001684D985|nr:HAMP domain-containing sensor histidine kinase [Trichocoleus sp. FACHB-262]MBD2120826.1 HAMP domain-containing histidine kinase [Trichocoleus sp. FACHB-262]
MIADVNYLQALRNCCRDEAAFTQLQQLLADPRASQHLSKLSGFVGSQPQAEASTVNLSAISATNTVLEPLDRVEALLQEASTELQEVRQRQAVLFHVMEHDLRPFLMGTLMVLRNLLKQGDETVTITRSRVERMVQASDRQLNAMSALLETYSTTEQTVPLQPEPVEFPALSQTILQDLAPLLSVNQARITPQLPAHMPPILADSDQIRRVVSHLVTATLQHNPPGLHLTLAAEVGAGMLRCTLLDDGQGWDSRECDRFFELQVRSPHACCSTSLGVQLHLCQQIIQAHGGEIGVINTEPGSIIWFTLPLATAVASSSYAPTRLAIAPDLN